MTFDLSFRYKNPVQNGRGFIYKVLKESADEKLKKLVIKRNYNLLGVSFAN